MTEARVKGRINGKARVSSAGNRLPSKSSQVQKVAKQPGAKVAAGPFKVGKSAACPPLARPAAATKKNPNLFITQSHAPSSTQGPVRASGLSLACLVSCVGKHAGMHPGLKDIPFRAPAVPGPSRRLCFSRRQLEAPS